MVVGARRTRSEELREHQYKEGYASSLEEKGIEWNNNIEHIREQVERAMAESAREVSGSVIVGGNSPKSVWWNDEVKVAVRRKEAAWKEVSAASNEEAKERCMEAYREEKRKVKRYIYQRKRN